MRIPRWLFIPLILVSLLYLSKGMFKDSDEPSLFDIPKTLEEEKYTLELYPVSHVNNVAVWSTSIGVDHDDYVYLTPASDLPIDYQQKLDSGYVIRAFGSYFKGKGIPHEYLNVKPKPDRHRVFLFETVEMVKPSVKF